MRHRHGIPFRSRVLKPIILVTAFIITFLVLHTVEAEEPVNVEGEIIKLRVVAYNVAYGQWAAPAETVEGQRDHDQPTIGIERLQTMAEEIAATPVGLG